MYSFKDTKYLLLFVWDNCTTIYHTNYYAFQCHLCRVENETVVLHYISYGMRIAVVKDAISQVYDDGAEKIQKHFHYSVNPKYIHSHKKNSYHYAVWYFLLKYASTDTIEFVYIFCISPRAEQLYIHSIDTHMDILKCLSMPSWKLYMVFRSPITNTFKPLNALIANCKK